MLDRPKTPWHLWLVGVVALLWNSGGAFDYYMTQTRNASYMAAFTPEQLEFFYGFPTWTVAAWAIAVWGAVAGSVLLLMRSRLAVMAFAFSFVGMAVTSVQNFVLSDVSMADLMGPEAMVFSVVIAVSIAFLWWYALRMDRAGVLR